MASKAPAFVLALGVLIGGGAQAADRLQMCRAGEQECRRGVNYWCCPKSQACNYGVAGRPAGGCLGGRVTPPVQPSTMPKPGIR